MTVKSFKRALTAGVAAIALFGAAQSAQAQAIISTTDGVNTVYLGINTEGHLNLDTGNVAVNSSRTGLSYSGPTSIGVRDATSPGCFCEGWGVSASGVSGYANVSTDGGAVGLTNVSFVSGASSATSVVTITGLNTGVGADLTVSQAYGVAVAGALFKDVVTITNTTGAAVTDVQYVRVMDWDVPFTEFADIVTIIGTATTTNLEYSNDNGFGTANPLASPGAIDPTTQDVDFVDSGPLDHGALFRFDFGALANGASVTFNIFYGAAPTEASMLAALASQSVELYSLGQSSAPTGDPVAGTPITYAFAFSGVGGEVVIGVPEPATLALFGFGLAGLAGMRRRKAARA